MTLRTNSYLSTSSDKRNWWLKNRYLLLRRTSQIGVLVLFLLGPLAGIWIIKGNLNSSMSFDVIPLTDPFILLQSWLAGIQLASQAVIGALIIALFYFLVGGRAFCAWVCPVNIVTDFAYWLRRRLGLKGNTRIKPQTRYWMLAMILLLAAVSGQLIWEMVNPVSILQRGVLFGMGAGWFFILVIFLFDLAVSRRGWCGHVCPMGAFYSLLGTHSPLRVHADKREACDKCMDCFAVCPEPQVIKPALFGSEDGISPLINAANCSNCGRCIDVCAKEVFSFGSRFQHKDTALNIHNETIENKEARL